jgi:hypothetical protein
MGPRLRVVTAFASLVLFPVGCRALPSDLDGRPLDPLAVPAAATVLVFSSPTCPLSNRLAPELARLHRRFAVQGARFYLVYPDRDETLSALRRHALEHGYPFAAVRDPDHRLVARAGATVTPEAAVFVSGRLVYRGRIDDRFVDFGKERPEPTRHDLADALAAILAGRSPPQATTVALGCSIR